MGAEEFTGVEVEGVGVVARGVIGGGVESIEAVELGFDFGSIGEGEAEAAEDLDGAVLHDGEWVQGPGGEAACRHGGVDACDGGGVGSVLKTLLTSVEGSFDGLAGGIEGGAKLGLFLVGEVAHFSGEGIERALFAEEFDAGVFKGRFGGRGLDGGEGIGLNLFGLLDHVEEGIKGVRGFGQ